MNEFSYKKQTCGEAVYDILSHKQSEVTVEEILDSYSIKFVKDF